MPDMNKPISVVLIGHNHLFRAGLTAIIRAQPGFHLLASFADVAEALESALAAKPDVVLLDVGRSDDVRLKLTDTVHRALPAVGIIVMGMLSTQHDVADYVRAGASGFVMQDASAEEFFETLRAVAGGLQVLPRALAPTLFAQRLLDAPKLVQTPPRAIARVTPREREVINALADGLSNKEIALRLSIAVHTVKSHVHNVLEKLSLNSRLEVAAFTYATASNGHAAQASSSP